MAAYNHAGAASRLAHAFSKYAPERPLLTELVPGISRADLAAAIIGNLSHQVKCNKTDLDVLQILIGYTRGNHDRVWTSYKRIKGKAEQCFAGWKGCCVKTVQRAVHFWLRDFPVLRLIDNPEERYAGDGEHLWVDAGNEKKGEGPVNHYDLSGLKPYVPQYLIRAFEALIGNGQYCPPPVVAFAPLDVETMLGGDPFDEAGEPVRDARKAKRDHKKARPVSKTAAAMRPMPSATAALRAEQDADVDFDFDPFPDLPENSPRSRQGSSNLIGMTSNISGGTPEAGVRNVEMSQINKNENGLQNPSPNRPAEAAMEVTFLSPVSARYTDAPAGANITANSGSQPGEQPPKKTYKTARFDKLPREVKLLTQKGVDVPMARKIYRDMKAEWVRAVLVYGREQGALDNETKKPGWYTTVYQAFFTAPKNQPATFPDDIQRIIEREERNYNESVWNAERAARAAEQVLEGRLHAGVQEATHVIPQQAIHTLPLDLDTADPLASLMMDRTRFTATPPPPAANKPAPAPQPTPPKAPPSAVPPELAAVWPAFLRSVKEVITPANFTHVQSLRGAAYRADEGGQTVVALSTPSQFTFQTFNHKPQLVQTVQSALAGVLGIENKQLTVSISLQERTG